MTRARRLAALTAGVLLLSACTPAPARVSPAPTSSAASPPVPAAEPVVFRPAGDPVVVATGLDAPWSIVPMPDGTVLVSLRDAGAVVEVAADGTVREVGIVPGVVPGGEGGLHGLAVRDDVVYAYVGAAEENRVVRMPLTGAAGARALGAAETILDGIPRARTHNGGRVAFGPDGYLYVTTGDAGSGGAAQDPDSLAGKILRITPTGAPAPGNPSGSAVYSLGHRNVQGIAWTRDGTLWASEFGQDTFDEINRITPGGNYGWPVHEGIAQDPAFVDPVAVFAPAEASPSGLAARGDTLFVAGLRGERVWMLDVAGGALAGAPVAAFAEEFGRLRDAVVTGDDLWLVSNETDGRGDPGERDDVLLRVALRS